MNLRHLRVPETGIFVAARVSGGKATDKNGGYL